MTRPHCLVTYDAGSEERRLLSECLAELSRVVFFKDLEASGREQALAAAEVLFSWNPPKELEAQEYRLLKNLRFIQLVSAGANHVPYPLIPGEVVIASNVGAFAEPMAEHVLGMVLALAKQLALQHARLKRGEFDDVSPSRRLRGSVCAVLGFGGIGQATARLMRALGAKIHAVNTSGMSPEPTDFLGTLNDLRYVLEAADIVVVTLPLNRSTKGLIGRQELSWMKTRAILINVARGDIIDEQALYEHLVTHPEFLAGIESWWIEPFSHGEFRTNYPFFDLPNFLGCPHNSAKVPRMMLEATRQALANVVRYLKQEPIKGLVRRGDYVAQENRDGTSFET
jgi:phosphoglycerate dehydrogenase-like enzyme